MHGARKAADAGGQPRSFGTTRDTAVPPDNRPKRSPNGQWEAFVSNYNLVVRPVDGKDVKALSNDGSEGKPTIPNRSPGRPTR